MSTRVSILGTWRKGKAGRTCSHISETGLYLKRKIGTNDVFLVKIPDGDTLAEYDQYEYIGPISIPGVIDPEKDKELIPGIYLTQYPWNGLMVSLVHTDGELIDNSIILGPLYLPDFSPPEEVPLKVKGHITRLIQTSGMWICSLANPAGVYVVSTAGIAKDETVKFFNECVRLGFSGADIQ